jgi:hypothetical protein
MVHKTKKNKRKTQNNICWKPQLGYKHKQRKQDMNKGNNKITELRTILQRESQSS